jgi:hypothetical protein
MNADTPIHGTHNGRKGFPEEHSEITADLPKAALIGFSVQSRGDDDCAIKYLSLPVSEISDLVAQP